MNLPGKDKKVDQHNFPSYRESREWLYRNNFKSKGMVLEEPWSELFVERFEKDGFVALAMNITYISQSIKLQLSFDQYEKPYQIDIATKE